MMMYNFEDIMIKLDDMEKKLDELIERSYSYKYYSTHMNTIDDIEYRAEVCKRNDGVWCVEKFINDKLKMVSPMGIHNESYAEDAAENFVFQIGAK
jgi:hypothetical protein